MDIAVDPSNPSNVWCVGQHKGNCFADGIAFTLPSLWPCQAAQWLRCTALASHCRAVGPANYSATSSACGQPFGGPLLKWDYAASRFSSVAGINAAGYRVAVMPETHMPWIVDGCGQLRGWTANKKALFGPTPQTKTFFDIAAVNGSGGLGVSATAQLGNARVA